MNRLFSSGLLWDISHIPVNSLGITTDEDSRPLVWSTLSSTFPIKYTVLQMYSGAIRAALTLVLSVLWKITACSNNVKNNILLCPRSVTLVDCHYTNGSLSLCLTGKLFTRNENIYIWRKPVCLGDELHAHQLSEQIRLGGCPARRDLCSCL